MNPKNSVWYHTTGKELLNSHWAFQLLFALNICCSCTKLIIFLQSKFQFQVATPSCVPVKVLKKERTKNDAQQRGFKKILLDTNLQ